MSLDKIRKSLTDYLTPPSRSSDSPLNSPLNFPSNSVPPPAASQPSPASAAADASLLLHSSSSSSALNDELKAKLELRDIFRNEQLFNQLLPRSPSLEETWTQEGFPTYTDQWSCDSQFIPMDSTKVLFSSALSGFLASVISTPFDVVKNFWIFSPQFRGTRNKLSTREVASILYKQNGLKSFYTGFGVTCCTLIPSNLIFFYAYEHYRYEGPPAIASVRARFTAILLTMPAEYLRTRVQANVGEITVREIIRTVNSVENLRSYTKGILATLMRDAPFSAFYWTLNEKFKSRLQYYDKSYKERSTFHSKFVYPFISGATAAAIATVATHPLDVIKTNIQGVANLYRKRGSYYRPINGVASVTATIYKAQGIAGFYVGLIPRLAKIIPSCAVLLATYDFSKATFTTPETNFEMESF